MRNNFFFGRRDSGCARLVFWRGILFLKSVCLLTLSHSDVAIKTVLILNTTPVTIKPWMRKKNCGKIERNDRLCIIYHWHGLSLTFAYGVFSMKKKIIDFCPYSIHFCRLLWQNLLHSLVWWQNLLLLV